MVAPSDKPRLSSAWDETLDRGGGKGNHGGSSTALDDPLLRGMSPEEFASHEEWERSDWDEGGGKKKKKTKKKDKVCACVWLSCDIERVFTIEELYRGQSSTRSGCSGASE